MKYIAFLAFIGISFAANAQPEEDFLAALNANNLAEANQIFEQNDINPDFLSSNELFVGYTPLLAAARTQQWALVERMLHKNPNINATPSAGRSKGITPFWLAARFEQWALLERMLTMRPDFKAAPAEGRSRGRDAMELVARNQQWVLAGRMLAFGAPCQTLLGFAVAEQQWELVARILVTCNANLEVFIPLPGMTMRDILNTKAPVWLRTLLNLVAGTYPYLNRLDRIFDRSLLAFLSPPCDLRTHYLPAELQWKLAEQAIWIELSELEEVPAEFKAAVEKRIKEFFKRKIEGSICDILKRDTSTALEDEAYRFVAIRVLGNIYPIDSRSEKVLAECSAGEAKTLENKMKRLATLKKWIVEVCKEVLGREDVLSLNERDQLVAILSNTKYRDVTRKWIRDQVLAFKNGEPAQDAFAVVPVAHAEEAQDVFAVAPIAHAEEPMSEAEINEDNKRPRGQDTGTESEDEDSARKRLKAELMLTVIRDQPGLDRDQVNARVEEMMTEGPVPMDVDDENVIRGNFTSVENRIDATATLRNAFLAAMMMTHLLSFGK